MAAIKCVYCQNVIIESIVKCLQCVDDISLCLQCFACSVEMGQHKKSHDYQILSNPPNEKELNGTDALFPCSDDPWSLAEEEALLDGVEHHGFGSWQEVAEFVKLKTTEQCEEHFTKYYINGNIGQATLPTVRPITCIDHTKPQEDPGPPLDLTLIEQQELGYMALRDDFESPLFEYNNDAESLICDVSLHYTDTDVDTAYKLFLVDMYRHQLRERQWRKDVAKEYDVLHNCTSVGWRYCRTAYKKRSREEKEYQERFKQLGRFMKQRQYLDLFHTIRKQEKLQRTVKSLIKFNSQGYKSLHGKLRMHALQMNGCVNGLKKRRKKFRRFYR